MPFIAYYHSKAVREHRRSNSYIRFQQLTSIIWTMCTSQPVILFKGGQASALSRSMIRDSLRTTTRSLLFWSTMPAFFFRFHHSLTFLTDSAIPGGRSPRCSSYPAWVDKGESSTCWLWEELRRAVGWPAVRQRSSWILLRLYSKKKLDIGARRIYEVDLLGILGVFPNADKYYIAVCSGGGSEKCCAYQSLPSWSQRYLPPQMLAWLRWSSWHGQLNILDLNFWGCSPGFFI